MNEILNTLFVLFKEANPRSKPDEDSQMCMFWSTDNPPDILEGTKSFERITSTFEIDISEDEAIDIYDMNLLEASKYIEELQNTHSL